MAEKSGEEKNKDDEKPSTDKDREGPPGENATPNSKKKDSPDDCHLGWSVPPDKDPPDSK